MSHSLLFGIYLLICANALVCGGVVVFLLILLKRQREGFQYISVRLNQFEKRLPDKKTDTKKPQISIPVDEPIAKYEQVSLPDDVKINFVED